MVLKWFRTLDVYGNVMLMTDMEGNTHWTIKTKLECLSAIRSVKVVKQLVLCITVEVLCRDCSLILDAVDLFTTVPSSWGPDAVSLNVCILIPVLR